jgi:uncharacterized phage protein (TIGR02218 family)
VKTLVTNFQSHLDQGTTTLCHCWRLSLRDGSKLGFTDHDETLTFDGTNFEAQAGFTASEIHSSLGLNIDNLEAQGALQSTMLDQGRLTAGDFDNAEIEIWLVNWQDATQRVLQRKGHLGEVSYGQGHFTAEVRGLAHVLNQPKGRLFQYGCDATLGDGRCAANVSTVAFQTSATIIAIDGNSLRLAGLSTYVDEWFTRGNLSIGGRTIEIKRHRKFATYSRIDLWVAPSFTINIGDSVVVKAGCDKQYQTCKTKFANGANFRGFPTMPGTDFVLAVASTNANNNGGKRA